MFSGRFCFVLGFSCWTLPVETAVSFMLQVVQGVYIDRKPMEHVLQDQLGLELLIHTSVTLIARTPEGSTFCRHYIRSFAKGNVWGLQHYCGNPLCLSGPENMKTNTPKRKKDHKVAKFTCTKCGWASGWIPQPDFLTPMSGARFIFYHSILLSQEEELYSSTFQRRV